MEDRSSIEGAIGYHDMNLSPATKAHDGDDHNDDDHQLKCSADGDGDVLISQPLSEVKAQDWQQQRYSSIQEGEEDSDMHNHICGCLPPPPPSHQDRTFTRRSHQKAQIMLVSVVTDWLTTLVLDPNLWLTGCRAVCRPLFIGSNGVQREGS